MNFYYFQAYHTKIDIFIFELNDDDKEATLGIILQHYPIWRILALCIAFSVFCVWIARKILRLKFTSNRIFATIIANIILLIVLVIGIRGSISTFPFREDRLNMTSNATLNHLSANPIVAFSWALGHYKKRDNFHCVDLSYGRNLQNELFPIFFEATKGKITPIKDILTHPNKISHDNSHLLPHIAVVLMESFGSNMLVMDNKDDFDMLGELRVHFEAGERVEKNKVDFTFKRFLSNANNTAPSFSALFFQSPTHNIANSFYKNIKPPFSAFDAYKRAGYEIVYITSGESLWKNLGYYMSVLGADKIYDSNYIQANFKTSKAEKNAYGVPDEFAFKVAFEVLSKATKPTFVVILTTTNHPPFKIPSHFTPPKYEIDSKMKLFNPAYDRQQIESLLGVFTYSSDAFGKFITAIKDSNLRDKVIVAGSGDHHNRDIIKGINGYQALDYATPLYMYIPPNIASKLHFNPATLGSHKDIFPTLYALSLEDYDFLTLGGRNLFGDSVNKDFAYNEAIWIDKYGIYPANTESGYAYTIQNGYIVANDEKILPRIERFHEKYNALNWWQINYRLLGQCQKQ